MVPHLPGQVVGPPVETPIGNDTRSESRAHGEEDHVLAALAGSESMLGHGAGIGVVFDQAFRLELALQDSLDRYIVPGGKIGRPLDNPLDAVEWPAAAHSQPGNGGRAGAALRQHFADSRFDQIQRPLGPLRRARGELSARDDFRRI